MVFHSLKAIYFHIGKTAGTSVEKLLCPIDLDFQIPNFEYFYGLNSELSMYLQHATPAFIKQYVSQEVFSSYYKFTIVRNPFVRAASVYHYLIDQHVAEFGNFEGFVHGLYEKELKRPEKLGLHSSTQTLYTHINRELVCDHIAHFERLPSSMDPVFDKLGITTPLGKHNTHRYYQWGNIPVQDHYNSEMIDIMLDFYSDDFDNFGYSKDIDNLEPELNFNFVDVIS